MGEWRDELSKRVLVVVIKKAKCFNRVNNFLLARSDLDDSFNSLCLAIAFTKSPITSEMFNEKIEEMSNYMAEADSKKDKQASRLRMIKRCDCWVCQATFFDASGRNSVVWCFAGYCWDHNRKARAGKTIHWADKRVD